MAYPKEIMDKAFETLAERRSQARNDYQYRLQVIREKAPAVEELRRELTDVTDAALAATLKALIADGILWRQQFDEIPPRVEYRLTEKDASVVPILRSICQWAGIYRTEDPAHALPQCKKCNYRGEAPGGTGWAGA